MKDMTKNGLLMLAIALASPCWISGCSDNEPTMVEPEGSNEDIQAKADAKAAEVEGQEPT
jgi:hypothetical protein